MLGQVLVASVGVVAFAACGSSAPVSVIPADGGGGGGGQRRPSCRTRRPSWRRTPRRSTRPRYSAGMPAMTWQWVPIDGAICRDGSRDRHRRQPNPGSKKLMIYLEGGGACFNALTCADEPVDVRDVPVHSRFAGKGDGLQAGCSTASTRPTRWPTGTSSSFPFCTGDVHAATSGRDGHRRDRPAAVRGLRQRDALPRAYRADLPGSRQGPPHGHQRRRVRRGGELPSDRARAFGSVPVYDLDDSGPPDGDPYAAKCLQKAWADTWGFDKTVLADCGADCPDSDQLHARRHDSRRQACSRTSPSGSSRTPTTRSSRCSTGSATTTARPRSPHVSASMFTAGLLDSRAKLAMYPNFGGVHLPGHGPHDAPGNDPRHGHCRRRDAATVKLSDWVTTLVSERHGHQRRAVRAPARPGGRFSARLSVLRGVVGRDGDELVAARGPVALAQAAELSVESPPVEPQHLRREGLVAAHRLEHLHDVAALHLLHRKQLRRVVRLDVDARGLVLQLTNGTKEPQTMRV